MENGHRKKCDDSVDARLGRDYPLCVKESENKIHSCPPRVNNKRKISETESLNKDTEKEIKPEIRWPPRFKSRDLFFAVMGLAFFVGDLYTDWRLAVRYFQAEQIVLFHLTIGFIFGPSVLSAFISIVWYTMDHREFYITETEEANQQESTPETDDKTLTNSSTVELSGKSEQKENESAENKNKLRSLEYIVYMVKSWRAHPSRREHLQLKAIRRKQDAAILGLIDGFLESALQLILQIYLSVAVPVEMDLERVITLLLSLGSTALSHTVFYKTNRKSKIDKKNIPYIASAFYFLWRVFELSPRFLLLAVSVYYFSPWIFIAACVHIFCLFLCFIVHNPELKGICPNMLLKSAFLFLFSYIGLFCYLNLEEGKTRLRILLFYIVYYSENIVMAVLIFWFSDPDSTTLYTWTYSTLSFIPGFVLHFLFMFIYYKLFHPMRAEIKCLTI